MTDSYRRELNNGFGDALARAFEFAVTPVVFGVLGFLVDRWLGVVPLFTLLFSLTVLAYMFWKMWREYDAAMRLQEQKVLPSSRNGHAS
ncbi:MAG: AtpZ/AtpI family protein [Acidimicrobiia bacterium]|nr:AtpZ/AtpI family protein [Acidimicrobiia bacterium]